MIAALTIAGSDPSGGAGIQADLKTFHQFGVYGEAAITLITVQNTIGVSRVDCLDPALIAAQINAVIGDIRPSAAKTGALGSAAAIEAIASIVFDCPLIVDPVMISKHGAPLLPSSAHAALRDRLLPRAALVTPNTHEAAALAAMEVTTPDQMREAARRIAGTGVAAVLVKGGHLDGDAIDILYDGASFHEYRAARVHTRHTHGTGCTYSAAITALLASGVDLPAAVSRAKAFITRAIATAPELGAGHGPVNHFAST